MAYRKVALTEENQPEGIEINNCNLGGDVEEFVSLDDEYQPTISTEEENLYMIFKIHPVLYGVVNLTTMVYSKVVLLPGFGSKHILEAGLAGYSCFSFLMVFVLLPLFQLYYLVDKTSDQPVSCWSCWTFHGFRLLSGSNELRAKNVELSVENQGDEVAPRYIKVTQFMPFSAYNYIYMIQNRGKKMNTELPPGMTKFGAMRAFLFYWTCLTEYTLGLATLVAFLKDPVTNYLLVTSLLANIHAVAVGTFLTNLAFPWYCMVQYLFACHFLWPIKTNVQVPKRSGLAGFTFWAFRVAWKCSAMQF